jgi:hypothetical protein
MMSVKMYPAVPRGKIEATGTLIERSLILMLYSARDVI